MKQLLYSAKAREDMRLILMNIAADKPGAAVAFLGQLEQKARILMTFPHIGELRPGLGNEFRVLLHRRYGIYYRIGADAVTIERVLAPGLDVVPELFDQ